MERIDRRELIKLAGVSAMALSDPSITNVEPKSSAPLNVLILKSDEHNPKYSSVYGHPFIHTPNMERLAKHGTVFENHYCPSPLCRPSRSAFMSGLRVHQNQAYSNCNIFTSDLPTYGGVLNEQGVHTVHIGKTDVYRESGSLGFSEMILPWDRPKPGDINISRKPLAIRTGDGDERSKGFGLVEGDPFTDDRKLVSAAIDWLNTRAPVLGKPWTMEVNIGKPHFPHMVTKELWDMYAEHADLPKHGKEAESANHPYTLDLRAHFETDKTTESQIRGLRRGYYGCVTFVDSQLGRLLDALEKTGLSKNTILAYTSDHGEMLGKFGMWWKCSLYEDSVRVPLIVAGPGFKRNHRVKTPVDQMDFQASIFKSLRAKRPAHWVGQPLQRIATNDKRRIVFSEYHGHGTRAGAYVIRKDKWKLIYYRLAPHQLFDLETDPDELVNLAEKLPDRLFEMEMDLRGICFPEEEDRLAEETIQRQLKAIRQAGYKV